MIKFLRSSLFMAYFLVLSLILVTVTPLVYLGNKRILMDRISVVWTWVVLWGIKNICGIKWKITGLENAPRQGGYIVAGKHQSTWETFIMHRLFNKVPVYVLKKQLLKVPIFGWALSIASHISIDRLAGGNALKSIIKQGTFYLKEGHNIIIFPQGTRVPIGKTTAEYPYKPGILGIVRALKCDVVPMAVNSGKFWRKKQFLKNPGTIRMEFMKPIKYKEIAKMSKTEFMKKLESMIEKKSMELARG